MFLYVLKKELLHSIGVEQDMLVVHAFDAHGEEHGRSDEGFAWALGLEGAVDGTKLMNLKGVADLQGEMLFVSSIGNVQRLIAMKGFIGQAQGLTNSYWSPLAIPEMTEEVVVRSFEWFDKVSAAEGSIKDNGYLIFEVMQKVRPAQTSNSIAISNSQIQTTFNHSSLTRASTAWPHPLGARHILLLGTGCRPDASESENKLARKLIMEGYDYIFENRKIAETDFVPNTIEDFHDTKKVRNERNPLPNLSPAK